MIQTNAVDFFRETPTGPGGNLDIILAIWDVGSPENAGRSIRLAHNLGAKQLLLVKDEVKFRQTKIKKTAGFSYDQMDWKFISEDQFWSCIPDDYKLVALETCTGSANLYDTKLPGKIVLLGGSESHGLPESVISNSFQQVYIPMPGGCKSMNITHALSVAAFEWYRQQLK